MTRLLAEVARTGDRAAFGAVFAFFAPRVKSYMMTLGVEAGEAEDLAQETLLRVWRKCGQYDPSKASASTWIYAIARNLRVDAARGDKTGKLPVDDPTLQPAPEPTAEDQSLRAERDERVRAAFDALPPAQRDVMRLHFFEDAPHSAVAAALGVPLGTVKSRLRLAFEKVRKELGDC